MNFIVNAGPLKSGRRVKLLAQVKRMGVSRDAGAKGCFEILLITVFLKL